jgi:hypothetical protein
LAVLKKGDLSALDHYGAEGGSVMVGKFRVLVRIVGVSRMYSVAMAGAFGFGR